MKERKPLTPHEQELAAKAFGLTGYVVKKYRRKFSTFDIDWEGEIAVRICKLIGTYDPAKSGLQTWATLQALGACKDAMRREGILDRSGKLMPRTWLFGGWTCRGPASFEEGRETGGITPSFLAVAPPEPDPAETSDTKAYLLRGLKPLQKEAVWQSIVEGRTLREIAADFGLSESRLCQLREMGLAFLRKREGVGA